MAAWLTSECSYVTSDQWCYSPLPDSPFTSYQAPQTESLRAEARAISPLTATLNICVCVHPCATTTSVSTCVCVYVCDISSSSLHSFLVKAIGDQWRLKVTNHPSSPTLPSNPPQPTSTYPLLLHPLPSPLVLTVSPRREPPGEPGLIRIWGHGSC